MATTGAKQQQHERLSQEQRDLLDRLQTSLETGLTQDQVRLRRLSSTSNVVDPPIKCPTWVCCLLPCIKHVPSMKAYRAIVPQDAEVKRSGKWVRYDASSILVGDIIRIEAGDVVPADGCVLLVGSHNNDEPLLVDLRSVTGEVKPRAITTSSSTTTTHLCWGGLVVQGTAVCVVTAIGPDTRVAQLIRNKQFPPPPVDSTDPLDDEEGGGGRPTLDGQDEEERSTSSSSSANNVHADQGISLLSRRVA